MKKRQIDKSIASPDNAVFRSLLDCLTSKGVKKHGLFLVSGEKVVRDLLLASRAKVRDLILNQDAHLNTDESPALTEIARLIQTVRAKHPQVSVLALAQPLFDKLDAFGTRSPLLALEAWEIPKAALDRKPEGLEIICALSDPSNLGALQRSAAAFGASRLILLNESASPFHPRAVRAASGATFDVPLLKGPALADLEVPDLLALDMEGESLPDFRWPRNARLLLGEEGRGVQGKGVRRLRIPIVSGVESLNATVAASIALYSYAARSEKG